MSPCCENAIVVVIKMISRSNRFIKFDFCVDDLQMKFYSIEFQFNVKKRWEAKPLIKDVGGSILFRNGLLFIKSG